MPHLYALEQVFDRSVFMLQANFPAIPPSEVAEATALWVAAEARTELILREMRSEWLERIVATEREGAELVPSPGEGTESGPSPTLIAQPA